MASYIIVAIIAYAIGSINFSIIISKKIAGFDVREKGSGNAGTTNILRSVGKKAAVLTLLCDVLKGVVAVLIAYMIAKVTKNADKALLVQIAGILVVIGHSFPIFFEFKGGNNKLANRVNMFNICACYYGFWQNGIIRFDWSSYTISCTNSIYTQ